MKYKLPALFFARPTLHVAKELLGKYLVRRVGGVLLSGKITEVEAYVGEDDLACHASRGRTLRTEGLYGPPGTLYVYLIYGMYWCLNIVTEKKDFPAAVLIRGVEPAEGIDKMLKNRGRHSIKSSSKRGLVGLTDGPGKLCQAFGITGKLHGKNMGSDTLVLEDRGERIIPPMIISSPRIGVDYAKHSKDYPWRFVLVEKGKVKMENDRAK